MKQLENILARLEAINDEMKRESLVWEAELNDRMAKGITDSQEAVKHYNEWMIKCNMSHLCVK